jgi:hypothetical protein
MRPHRWLLRLLTFVLLTCAVAWARPPPFHDFPITSAQRDQVVRETFAALRAEYVFPERLEPALAQLRTLWSSDAFGKIDDARTLVERMNADFQDVFHDLHLGIFVPEGLPESLFNDPDEPDPKLAAEQEAFERTHGFGVVAAKVLPGGIGYLRLDAFAHKSPGQEQAYARAMKKVARAKALILDLRKNGGGDGDAVADLVGYFLDHKTLLQWDVTRSGEKKPHFSAETVAGPRFGEQRPVYVLTSRQTASAAEECAYDLQTQKRATVVGSRTAGGANHNKFVRVAARFALSVPYMTTENAVTHQNWEGTGVRPDVEVAPKDALAKARQLSKR